VQGDLETPSNVALRKSINAVSKSKLGKGKAMNKGTSSAYR